MAQHVEHLASRLGSMRLPSFGHDDNNEDAGENTDHTTVAGGGRGARESAITKGQLRVSNSLKAFLAKEGVIPQTDITYDEPSQELRDLLDKSHLSVASELTDRSHPLPEYFISSSHNTYLLANQLYGDAKASAYSRALETGSRCVEIDAWDNEHNKDEPKVTHGYTLTASVPFRSVCETIRDVIDTEAKQATDTQGYRAAPIILSLENHCDAHGQERLVAIMHEVWGDRLLSRAVREEGKAEQNDGAEHVTLSELGSKIVLIVEYYFPEPTSTSSTEPTPSSTIIPSLAALGVYAQSVKPRDNSWFEQVSSSAAQSGLIDGPHHHLINVSETQLASHLPAASREIAAHNAHHLMRVYPKGTRIGSDNLDPLPFWSVGAQICALNWQTFGAELQLNEALFAGTEGYVLKPAALRSGGDGRLSTGRRTRLRLHVAGATDVPAPPERHDDLKPYLTCSLVHPDTERPEKRKTAVYKHHKITGALHRGDNSPVTEPVWDETLEWEYEENEMVFLRLFVKSDDAFAANPIYALAAVRLAYVVGGWSLIRMLDLKGRETHCTLLVKFELETA